jgi:hypothetical protein
MGMPEPYTLSICIVCEQILSWFTLSAKKPIYKLTLFIDGRYCKHIVMIKRLAQYENQWVLYY